MDRRAFLKVSIGATGTAAVAGLAPARAEERAADQPVLRPDARILQVAVHNGADHPAAGWSVARMARRLADVTDGRLGLSISPMNTVTGPVTAVSSGVVDVAFGPLADDVAVHPAFAVFAGLPGATYGRSDAVAAWFEAAGGRWLLDDLAAGFGVKAMVAGHSGAQPSLWVAAAPEVVRIEGLRIATAGVAGDVLARLGAVPVRIAAEDYAGALQEGAVDAVEAAPLTALALGLPQVVARYATPAFHRAGQVSALAVRAAVWEQLSGPERAALELVAGEEMRLSIAEQAAHAPVLAEVVRAAGVEPARLSPESEAAVEAEVARALAEIARTDAAGERIVASLMAFFDGGAAPAA